MQINGKAAAAALVKARAAMKATVTKDSKGNFGKYADLANVVAAITPALSDNGLALVQEIAVEAETVTASATLLHESGETIEFWPMVLPVGDRKGAQAIGAVITYARRYQLMALFGLAPDDDLDNAAQNAQEAPGAQKQRPMTTDTRAPYNARPSASTPPLVERGQSPTAHIDDVPPVDENGPELFEPTPEPPVTDALLRKLHALGEAVYARNWDAKRHALIEKITSGRTHSSKDLSEAEALRMIAGMQAKAAVLAQPDQQAAARAERGEASS